MTKKFLPFTLLFAFLGLFQGCICNVNLVKMYSGPDRDRDSVAILIVDYPALAESIDDQRAGVGVYLLLPGQHNATVSYLNKMYGWKGVNALPLRMNLQAGDTYTIGAFITEGGTGRRWRPIYHDMGSHAMALENLKRLDPLWVESLQKSLLDRNTWNRRQ